MVIGSREGLSIDEYLILKTGINTVEKVYKGKLGNTFEKH